MSEDLSEKLEELLSGAYNEREAPFKEGLAYQEAFRDEGVRKTKFILDRISELPEKVQAGLEAIS